MIQSICAFSLAGTRTFERLRCVLEFRREPGIWSRAGAGDGGDRTVYRVGRCIALRPNRHFDKAAHSLASAPDPVSETPVIHRLKLGRAHQQVHALRKYLSHIDHLNRIRKKRNPRMRMLRKLQARGRLRLSAGQLFRSAGWS
jgi:hypothetical protein